MRAFLIVLFIFSCDLVESQTNEYVKTFDWVVDTFSKSDAGFQIVVDKKGMSDYESFTAEIRDKVGQVENDDVFIKLIHKWLLYFRSQHINFGLKDNLSSIVESPNTDFHNIDNRLYAEKLSDKTIYVRIPSFDFSEKSKIDSLLNKMDKEIQEYPNLIIDIRNSGGGSDWSWDGLTKYIYTNPIRLHSVDFKVSDLNINALNYAASELQDAVVTNIAERMSRSKDDFVPFDEAGEQVRIQTKSEVLKKPERVGIIINEYNASADEAFLLVAKQSMKTKLFGRPSTGCFDISNMNIVDSDDGKYSLGYAMSVGNQMKYMPLDGIGVQPDFLIDDKIGANKWVEYVRKTLEY